MSGFQSSKNFGFDTDMEMDFTEHLQKRGEVLKVWKNNHLLRIYLNFICDSRKKVFSKEKSLSIAIFRLSFFSLLLHSPYHTKLSSLGNHVSGMYAEVFYLHPPICFKRNKSLFTFRVAYFCVDFSLSFFSFFLLCNV